MRRLFVLSVVWMSLLGSCSPTLKPRITVTNAGQTMTITGKGFSTGVTGCARVTLLGLPAPDTEVPIKPQPVCTHSGTFTATYTYNYVCEPTTSHKLVVVAVDTTEANPAFANTSIAWGPKCAIAGTCGTLNLPACPNGCMTGGVNAEGICVHCGTEGQPACNPPGQTPFCDGGFFPNLEGGQVVCTAKCGTANNSPCITQNQTKNGTINVYTCYNGSTIGGDCVCVYNDRANACQEVDSKNSNYCQAAEGTPPGCTVH